MSYTTKYITQQSYEIYVLQQRDPIELSYLYQVQVDKRQIYEVK